MTTDTTSPIPGSIPSDGSRRMQILIVGRPFTGKTTAALTCPYPVVLDLDHKCPATIPVIADGKLTWSSTPVQTVPFWDAQFCDKYARRVNPNLPVRTPVALVEYLKAHVLTPDATKRIPYDRTLILDSVSSLEDRFHNMIIGSGEIPLGKNNKPDGFYLWARKLDYFAELSAICQAWPGWMIWIMHEQDEFAEDGTPTGRIKPLLSGSFANKIASKFTCMFRQRAVTDGKSPTQYVWDVKPTRAFDSNNTLGIEATTILAGYNTLAEQLKKLGGGAV